MSRRTTPPKYSRHSSRQARVRIDGKVRYLGAFGSPESKRKYRKLVAQWLEDHEVTHRECPDLAVGKLATAYMRHAKTYYRKNGQPTGHLHVVRAALRTLVQVHRGLPAAELSPRKVKRMQQRLIAEGKSRKYINDLTSVVKRLLRWAIEEELVRGTDDIRDILARGVCFLKQGRTEAFEPEPVRPVPDAFIDAILPYVRREVWGLVQFQLATGARPGEALIVRGRDLNTQGDVWEFTPVSHKAEHHGKARIIMVGPKGQAVLKPFLVGDLEAYLFSPDGGQSPYRRDSYRNAISRGCESAFDMPYSLRHINAHVKQQDLDENQRAELIDRLKAEARQWRKENCWSPNRLRHNFGTAARRHAGIEAARVTLGHSSAAVSEVYAERDLEAARQVVAKIG